MIAGKVRGARRHAGLGLDEADEIQAEAAREIRPAVVVGDDRHGLERRQFRFPFGQLRAQASEEGRAIGLVTCRIGRIDPRQRFEDSGGDDLGILRVEPIMRIAAAMRMTVARADAHPAQFQHRDGERSIDIAGAAAADLAVGGLREQAIDPQVVVEPDAHQHARILQPQDILRLRLIFLGVHVRRDETDRRDPVAAHGLGQAAQVGRRGDDLDALAAPDRAIPTRTRRR